MQDELRREVQLMIEAVVAHYHAENLERFGAIKAAQAEMLNRIIGIDSNGTGRKPGVIQQLQQQVHDVSGMVTSIDKKLGGFIEKADRVENTWNKAKFYENLRWIIPVIVTTLALIVAYLAYRQATHTAASHVSVTAPYAVGGLE